MLSSQLFWRVFAVYAGLTVCTALAFVIILSARHRSAVDAQVEQRLREDAAAVRGILDLRSPEQKQTLAAIVKESSFQQLATAITRDCTSEIAICDGEGHPLWRTIPSTSTFDDPLAPELSAARQVGYGFHHRAAPSGGEDRLFYATRIRTRDPQAGYVRAMLPLSAIRRELSTADYQLWAAAATIGILALVITYVVVGRIIGPLEILTQAAQRLAEGDSPQDIQIGSHNEIGTLASVFNSMSHQLSARIRDLQEQRQQLENNHERLETVLGAMLEGVIAIDADQRILFANNAAIRLLDLKPSTMLGRPLWEAVRHPQLQDLVLQMYAEGTPPRLELEIPRTHSTVAVTASRLPGRPSPGAVLVMHDVTELRRLESLRREFVQNVSHELKTPLSSISAYADTLLDGGLDDPGCNRQFVQRIADQADRLHALILDLLALGRMEAEEPVFDVEPTDVTRIVQASVDAHQGVADSKRLQLSADGPSHSLYGLADDEGLRTIIDNLLDNAINYTPAGGRVTVRWRADDDSVLLEVEDTGVGIAREHQTRIFQRFYRIDKARSRELGGTGLGLAIVKHLCQVFGGSVRVTSQLGQGSTFTVQLRSAEHLAAR